jgi:hypothetical protein
MDPAPAVSPGAVQGSQVLNGVKQDGQVQIRCDFTVILELLTVLCLPKCYYVHYLVIPQSHGRVIPIIFREGDWGSARLGNFPKGKEQANDRAPGKSQDQLAHRSVLPQGEVPPGE